VREASKKEPNESGTEEWGKTGFGTEKRATLSRGGNRHDLRKGGGKTAVKAAILKRERPENQGDSLRGSDKNSAGAMGIEGMHTEAPLLDNETTVRGL